MQAGRQAGNRRKAEEIRKQREWVRRQAGRDRKTDRCSGREEEEEKRI